MNDTVFFVDIRDHKVKSGTVQSIGINKSGYIKIGIKVGETEQSFHVDQALITDSKEKAKEIQKIEKAISTEMQAIVEIYNTAMNEKRKELLGEPEMAPETHKA